MFSTRNTSGEEWITDWNAKHQLVQEFKSPTSWGEENFQSRNSAKMHCPFYQWLHRQRRKVFYKSPRKTRASGMPCSPNAWEKMEEGESPVVSTDIQRENAPSVEGQRKDRGKWNNCWFDWDVKQGHKTFEKFKRNESPVHSTDVAREDIFKKIRKTLTKKLKVNRAWP